MIQRTVYLRDEDDLALWKAIPNKAEWLHEHLNPPAFRMVGELRPNGLARHIDSSDDVVIVPFEPSA